MLYKDFEGRTEQEALTKALEELQISEDRIHFEVLSSSKSGFLGIGKSSVKIRVFYKEVDPSSADGVDLDFVISHIISIVSMIDAASTSSTKTLEGDRYLIQVESPDPARLIGKHGRIIEAIQDVINGILQRHSNRFKVVVDVVGYNQSQKNRIVTRAKGIASVIANRGGMHKLEPMNPFYRRLVHLELQKIKGIVTKSEGEGKLKSVVISRESEGSRGGQKDKRPFPGEKSFRSTQRIQKRPY